VEKEIEEILDDIERYFLTATDAEQEYWKLSPDERVGLPESLRVRELQDLRRPRQDHRLHRRP